MYHFKSDFRKRLIRLYNCIGDLLREDFSLDGFASTKNLFPLLYSLFSQLYCKDFRSFLKKVKRL